jgi:hypothetical protein
MIIVSPRLKIVGDGEVEVGYKYGLDASSKDSELHCYLYGCCYDPVYQVTYCSLVQQPSSPWSRRPAHKAQRPLRS